MRFQLFWFRLCQSAVKESALRLCAREISRDSSGRSGSVDKHDRITRADLKNDSPIRRLRHHGYAPTSRMRVLCLPEKFILPKTAGQNNLQTFVSWLRRGVGHDDLLRPESWPPRRGFCVHVVVSSVAASGWCSIFISNPPLSGVGRLGHIPHRRPARGGTEPHSRSPRRQLPARVTRAFPGTAGQCQGSSPAAGCAA